MVYPYANMAAVATPPAPICSKREHKNTGLTATPINKTPKNKQLRTSATESNDNSHKILQHLDDMEKIMASVTAVLTDFKVKLELQLKEEMKKLEDSLVGKNNERGSQ